MFFLSLRMSHLDNQNNHGNERFFIFPREPQGHPPLYDPLQESALRERERPIPPRRVNRKDNWLKATIQLLMSEAWISARGGGLLKKQPGSAQGGQTFPSAFLELQNVSEKKTKSVNM